VSDIQSDEQEKRDRFSNLLRHVKNVSRDCETIGSKLMENGEFELAKDLISNGRVHDHSKFKGIEWKHLGVPGDPMHQNAWLFHVTNNKHHPEAWDSIHVMDRLYIAEMVCDWHSRSSEMGTGLRDWIKGKAMERFNFDACDKVYRKIKEFVDLLLDPTFT
jgi:hypothetical protein